MPYYNGCIEMIQFNSINSKKWDWTGTIKSIKPSFIFLFIIITFYFTVYLFIYSDINLRIFCQNLIPFWEQKMGINMNELDIFGRIEWTANESQPTIHLPNTINNKTTKQKEYWTWSLGPNLLFFIFSIHLY